MEPEKDEKYWKDYTEFIEEVEILTELSPADLLSQYEILIAELNDINEEDYLEWQYEFDYDLWTRQKIQNVIEHKPISENILLKHFKGKINELDLELKKYILNSNQIDWWNKPQIDFKNRNKASR